MAQINQIYAAFQGVRMGANLRFGRTALWALAGFGAGYLLVLTAGFFELTVPTWNAAIASGACAWSGFVRCEYQSYREKLYVLLARVTPTQPEQYKAVQEAAGNASWGEFEYALLEWLSAERRCIEAPTSPNPEDVAKRAFVSKR